MTSLTSLIMIFTISAFFSGVVISKATNRKRLKALNAEMSLLKMSLQGAENLLSERAAHDWRDPGAFAQPVDLAAEPGPEGSALRDMEDTDDSHEDNGRQKMSLPVLSAFSQPDERQIVCIKKVIGTQDRTVKLYARVTGLERNPPLVGERYRIVLEDGSVLHTSVVTKVTPGYFQTENSVYEIEMVEMSSTSEARQRT
jgi:hypothetical protein